MRHAIGWVATLSLPFVLLTGSAVAQKKDDKAKEVDKDTPKDVWVKAGQVSGKVVTVYEDKRKLRVSIPVPKLNAGALQQMQNAQTAYAQAAARRDINGMRSAQQQQMQAQRDLYRMENTDIEVQALDDVVVRMARPKEDFDDKGKIKKYTKAELKEMKGPDPKLPGYKAEFGDVQPEQVVQLTVVRKKGAPLPKPKRAVKGAKGKAKDDEDLAGLLEDNTPQVSMIYILASAPVGK